MLLLGWPEPELKAGSKAGEGVVIGKGLRGRGGWGGAGAPVDGTDIFGQVVLQQ